MSVRATSFAVVPTALLRDPRISPQAKALYTVIRSFADYGQTTGAHPGQATLLGALGFTSPSYLVRLRDELGRFGWLRWFVVRSGGAVVRTDYECADDPWAAEEQPSPSPEVESPSIEGELSLSGGGGVGLQGGGALPLQAGGNREPFTESPGPRTAAAARRAPEVDPLLAVRGFEALRVKLQADAWPALEGYVRAAEHPDAVVAAIAACGPDGAEGRAGVGWLEISRGLIDMLAAGKRFAPNILRAFIRGIARDREHAGSNGNGHRESVADRTKRRALELAQKQGITLEGVR